ncbi:MAG: magnesium transporter CorA family protein [Selenomonadaceae bacterium]|nr:magnesium transporter CorA family protein [Selenomonadaceae bacterium]
MVEIYKSQETGHLEKLTLKSLQKGSWINIVDPTPYELREVSEVTQVEPDFLRAALDEEERSHLDVEENSIMILTNVPIVYEEESYDTLPLSIILTKQYIITVCLEETPVMSSFNARTARLFHTYKRTQFLLEILYRSSTFYLRYLRQINKLSDEIEEQLRKDMRNNDILRLMELQRGLTYFNASLRSNDAVFEKLLRFRNNRTLDGILEFYEEDEDLLEDVIIENKQAREMVEMYSQILSQMADIFSSIISNNQNMVMKFLAAMTIIIAVPTVIASFFGMNVPVPLSENHLGFVIVILIAVLASTVAAIIFWRKNMFWD